MRRFVVLVSIVGGIAVTHVLARPARPAGQATPAAAATTPLATPMDSRTCPLHEQHMKNAAEATSRAERIHDDMNVRGASAMGFDQTRTSHHFLLAANGGAIEVHANSADDRESREQIVTHLRLISREFAEGNFSAPFATHAAVPPGVPAMKRLKDRISYSFEETAFGGRVVMATRDGEALAAIHEFIRYQIREHRTGDPLELQGR